MKEIPSPLVSNLQRKEEAGRILIYRNTYQTLCALFFDCLEFTGPFIHGTAGSPIHFLFIQILLILGVLSWVWTLDLAWRLPASVAAL